MKSADHVVMTSNGRLVCQHCKTEETVKFPLDVSAFTKASLIFTDHHKDCKP